MKRITKLLITTSAVIVFSGGVFILGFSTVPLGAEESKKPSAEERLAKVEKEIQYFLIKGGINKEQFDRQKALTDLEGRLGKTATKLADTEISLSSYYVQIILAILAVVGVAVAIFGGLAGLILKQILEKNVANIVENTESRLTERMKFLSQADRIMFFRQLSFFGWEGYGPHLELLGALGEQERHFLEERIIMARWAAWRGLQFFEDQNFFDLMNKQSERDRDDVSLNEIHLWNDYLYHSILALGLPKNFNPSEIKTRPEEKYQIMLDVKKCQTISQKKIYRNFWYQAMETVAFAKVMIGNNSEREEGMKIIKNLLGEETTVPDDGFLPPTEVWKGKIKNRWKAVYDMEGCTID